MCPDPVVGQDEIFIIAVEAVRNIDLPHGDFIISRPVSGIAGCEMVFVQVHENDIQMPAMIAAEKLIDVTCCESLGSDHEKHLKRRLHEEEIEAERFHIVRGHGQSLEVRRREAEVVRRLVAANQLF